MCCLSRASNGSASDGRAIGSTERDQVRRRPLTLALDRCASVCSGRMRACIPAKASKGGYSARGTERAVAKAESLLIPLSEDLSAESCLASVHKAAISFHGPCADKKVVSMLRTQLTGAGHREVASGLRQSLVSTHEIRV